MQADDPQTFRSLSLIETFWILCAEREGGSKPIFSDFGRFYFCKMDYGCRVKNVAFTVSQTAKLFPLVVLLNETMLKILPVFSTEGPLTVTDEPSTVNDRPTG